MSKDFERLTLIKKLEKIHVVAIGPFTADELKNFEIANTVSQVHTVLGSFDTMQLVLSN